MSRTKWLRLISRIIGPLPFGLVRRLGRAAGHIAYRLGVGSPMVPIHLARMGADPSRAPEVIAKYGEYWAETLWLRESRLDEILQRLTVEGIEHYDAAHAGGQGAIYALPHAGNWEFAAILPMSRGIPLIAVAEKLRDTELTDWFTETRRKIGIEIVLADGSRKVMTRLIRGVQEGAGIALLADRDVTGGGAEVEFFGEVTRMPAGPVALGISTGAPVLPIGCFTTDDGHLLVFRPPLEIPEAEDRAERIRLGVQALAHEFEALLRRAPEQWHLLQPNWPSDPGWRVRE